MIKHPKLILTLSALTASLLTSTAMAWPGWQDRVTVSGGYISHLSYSGDITTYQSSGNTFTIEAKKNNCSGGEYTWLGITECSGDGYVNLTISNSYDSCDITLVEGSYEWNASIISNSCYGFSGVSLSHDGYDYTLSAY